MQFLKFNYDKLLYYQLIKVYGLNDPLLQRFFVKLGLNKNVCLKNLNIQEIEYLKNFLNINCKNDNDLKRVNYFFIKRLYDNNSYRGIRHKLNLPLRGQRTHTNAQTSRQINHLKNNIINFSN